MMPRASRTPERCSFSSLNFLEICSNKIVQKLMNNYHKPFIIKLIIFFSRKAAQYELTSPIFIME